MKAKAPQMRSAIFSPAKGKSNDRELYLRLYVTGSTPNSERAKINLDVALLEVNFLHSYRVEIIDVLADATSAITEGIIVTPTLVAFGPNRRLVMIGDLSDRAELQRLLKAVAGFGQHGPVGQTKLAI